MFTPRWALEHWLVLTAYMSAFLAYVFTENNFQSC